MPRTPYVPKRPPLDPCPVEEVLGMIGGKWKVRLLLLLAAGPQRLSALRRGLEGRASNEVLITQLAGLAADGLVEVVVERNGATSHRLYELTASGQSLLPALDRVAAWGAERPRERGHEWQPPVMPTAPEPRMRDGREAPTDQALER